MYFWYSSNLAGFNGPQSACGRNELMNFSWHPCPFCFTTATNPQIGNWITPNTDIVQPIPVHENFDYFTISFWFTFPICWRILIEFWILPYAQLGNGFPSYVTGRYVMNVYNKMAINISGVSRPQHSRQYKPVFLFIMNSMSRQIRSTPIRGTETSLSQLEVNLIACEVWTVVHTINPADSNHLENG